MASVLGIDIGTSSAKVMLLDVERGVIGVESRGYDVLIPQIGYAQQDPDTWWEAVISCLSRLRTRYSREYREIVSVGLSGQMHGLVMVDRKGKPVRPAILWLDQRTKEECGELDRILSTQLKADVLRNRIFTGFALPSLLWVKKHEPECFRNIHKVMQPKDYIRYKLTGMMGAEVTDASATLMFDVVKRDWAWPVIDLCGFPRELFPQCHESGEIQGTVDRECSELTGISPRVQVIYGMGDQQAQSIGNGVFREGMFICNVGTGGQVSAFSNDPVYDAGFRTQTFCHCTGKAYTIYGAILNAGMSLKWLKNNILGESHYDRLSRMAGSVPAGSGGLIFLPYLTGERTPHMDADARGMFFGLHLAHTGSHMARSVMEGVAFALRDCMTILEQVGGSCKGMISSGGGAASPVWLQIQADVLDKEIHVCSVSEQACLGACMLAGVSAGVLDSLEAAAARFVSYGDTAYQPMPEHVKLYDGMYETYGRLYEQVKELQVKTV